MVFRKKFWGTKENTPIVSQDGVVIHEYVDGKEMVDSQPVAVPVEFQRPPTMYEQIRTMVRSEMLARYAAENEKETFEESEDFDIGDDYDPRSPYENDFDPDIREVEEVVKEARKRNKPPGDAVAGPEGGPGDSVPPQEPDL